MFIYLDESGDLGFDFTKGGTSRFFVITLLVLQTHEETRRLAKAVERTLKNKVRRGRKKRGQAVELKGSKTEFAIKAYLWEKLRQIEFGVYSLILNKARVFDELRLDKGRLYNYISRLLIERCPFTQTRGKIILTLDKSKDQKEIIEFNRYLLLQIQKQLPPAASIEIYHRTSHESSGIQATDLFSWGIFRKYEREDIRGYSLFKKKIVFETFYLPNKKGL